MTNATHRQRATGLGSRLNAVVATLAAGALVSGSVVAGAGAARAADDVALTTVGQAGFTVPWQVPAVESQAAHGSRLGPDSAALALPGLPDGADGALVRVTVLSAAATRIDAAGTPALSVPAGQSASTTVLVPVVDGAVSLTASTPTDVRVEVLAALDGDAAAPGSVVTLAEPVTRAATADGELAGDAVGAEGITVGLVGEGGVPSTDVRAVFLTATVDAPVAGEVTIAGQRAHVPAGTTSITTVVTPDDAGAAEVAFAPDGGGSGSASLQVQVRGWVPEALQDAQAANVPGGFVPVDADAQDVTVPRHEDVAVTAAGPADAAWGLALVAADPAAATTLLDLGASRPGRGTGALVDPLAGATAQLAVVGLDGSRASARVRDVAVDAHVTWLGGILAAEAAEGAAPRVSITGPADGAVVDLAAGNGFQLTGTLSSATAVERVDVEADGTLVGTASLRHTPDGVRWTFEGAAPAGEHELTVRVRDRAGAEAADSVTITVHVPESSEAVVAPDTVVLPESTGGQPVVVSTKADQVVFGVEPTFAPGSVIASGATDGAPQGFLRRVVSIDQVGDQWVVHTEPAALTDAIWQADVDEVIEPAALGDPVVTEIREPAEGTELAPGDEPAVTLNSGDDVSLAPYPYGPDDGSTVDEPIADGPGTAEPVARTLAPPELNAFALPELSTFGLFDVDRTLSRSFGMAMAGCWQKGTGTGSGKDLDVSFASSAEKAACTRSVKNDGGVAVTGEAQVGVSLHVVLKISAHWSWGIPSVVVDDFQAVTTATGTANVTLDAVVARSWHKDYERRLAEIQLPTVTVMAGAVPIVITSEIEGWVEGSFDLDAKASLHLVAGTWHERSYGFTYSSAAGLKPVSTSRTTVKKPDFSEAGQGFAGEVGLDASFGPRLDITLSIYDAGGPSFSIGVRGGLTADVSGDWTAQPAELAASLEAYLGVRASGRVQLTVPIIDHVLLSADLFDIDNTYPVKSWHWTSASGEVGEGPGVTPVPEPTPSPTPTDPAEVTVASVSAGVHHSLAVTTDGRVYAWGWNGKGELGLGDTTDRHTPTLVPGLTNVATVAAYYFHSLAMTTDGRVYAWGSNDYGQLGLGDTKDRTTPTLVPGLTNVATVAADYRNSFAVTTDGRVYAWGESWEDAGQLPTLVPGLTNVATVAAGFSHSLAATTDGRVYAWGSNWYGQLGLGSTMGPGTGDLTPALVPGLTNVATVAADFNHSFAVTTDGRIYAWGSNEGWELGLGDRLNRNTPTLVPGLTNAAAVATAIDHSLAVTTDGRVYAWGWNEHGQLGLGGTMDTNTSIPTLVPSLTNVATVAANGRYSLAVTTDGHVYTWGDNRDGQLGLGDTSIIDTPTLVPGL